MNRKQKKVFYRIIAAAALLIGAFFIPQGIFRAVVQLAAYIVIGYDILRKAFRGIVNRQIFDESFLMAAATVGALLLGEFTEAVAVMLFFQMGELFEGIAVGKSRRSIATLMDIRPEHANIESEDGQLIKIDPNDVSPGSIIVVLPGERLPIDGTVTEGESSLDCSALTGESLPRDVSVGDSVLSGSVNLHGLLKVRTVKRYEDSTVARILELVENAGERKSKSESFISRFARYYTPVVCISALALAVLPPVVSIGFGNAPNWGDWIYRALSFLVISCPCALVISVPLSFFAGLGGAGSEGILIKGSNYLEQLSKVKCIVFDKTGTLTKGSFSVKNVIAKSISKDQLLSLAAHVECNSTHPIARSIVSASGKKPEPARIENIEELGGFGVKACIDGRTVAVGNRRLMEALGVSCPEDNGIGTAVHVCRDSEYLGQIVLADTPKDGAAPALEKLRSMGIHDLVMLTGDNENAAQYTAKELGISKVYARLLPEDKVTKVEELLSSMPKAQALAFVGDGINDAPVLSRADIGIAMGALGSDAAIEAADVVLMDDEPGKIAKAVAISKKCMRIVYENIVFAIGIKLLFLVLTALGLSNMWFAIFADVGVMVLAVLNAIRMLNVKNI
ncbi:MAG: cadmium-translocating P-type ATPase [Oscillospiraceae bacterium]|nr:cadmium-translocating P-type ATPase [Oscillospiraceae bacterium]